MQFIPDLGKKRKMETAIARQHESRQPKPAKYDPVYRDMQKAVNSMIQKDPKLRNRLHVKSR